MIFIHKDISFAPPDFFGFISLSRLFKIDLQSKQHIEEIVPRLQPIWRRWRCLNR
jgi:hypothetical protein